MEIDPRKLVVNSLSAMPLLVFLVDLNYNSDSFYIGTCIQNFPPPKIGPCPGAQISTLINIMYASE